MPWSYVGNRGIFPLILNFGIRWSLLVHFMLRCIILGNEHFYSLNRMPCLDILEKKKKSCCYLDLNPGLSSLYPSHCNGYAARTVCVCGIKFVILVGVLKNCSGHWCCRPLWNWKETRGIWLDVLERLFYVVFLWWWSVVLGKKCFCKCFF